MMMENFITLVGSVATKPLRVQVGADKEAISCRFTLSIHRKWTDRITKQEREHTAFHEVVAFRRLARNVLDTCQVHDSVIVIGRLNNRKGVDGIITELVADHIGLDLSINAIPLD